MVKLIEVLAKNTPLALIVIGLFIFTIGAAGGWPNPPLRIAELGWRIALAAMGAVVAGLGGLLAWPRGGGGNGKVSASCRKYGIGIVSPQDRENVPTEFQVSGTYKVRPPDDRVVLIEVHPETKHCWFKKGPITFDERRKSWSGKVRFGPEPGESRIIRVAVLGMAGQALAEYQRKVGERTGQWVSVTTLTPDVVECDSITVVRKL